MASFWYDTLGFHSRTPGLWEILFATLLSFTLATIISWLYKRTHRSTRCSQGFIHTMIILSLVVSVFVMVMRSGDADHAMATGFGMFAAFSMIRFRNTLSDSRDVGFVFFAMTVGLAVGARQYMLATAATLLISGIIWHISRRSWFAGASFTHCLRIQVPHGIHYDQAFAKIFATHLLHNELTSVDTTKTGTHTELTYNITLAPSRCTREVPGALPRSSIW
jgi:hypothetical protein